MSKICGIAATEPDPALAKHMEKVYSASWQDRYTRREIGGDQRVRLGHFNIGAFNPEPQPLFSPSGDKQVVFCGKLVDCADIRKRLIAKGARFALADNDAEFLLNLLAHEGTAGISKLNGTFSAAVWDAPARTLHIINDRLGFRPIYYHHDAAKGLLVFSSDLRGILDSQMLAERKLNWEACSCFLRFGHHLASDTAFEGVFTMPPACVLTFKDNAVGLESYWSPDGIAVRDDMTVDEAIEGAAVLFAQAIRRRRIDSKARQVVMLSGGQDSRHIAAELKTQGGAFTAYTTKGLKPFLDDRVLAARVAETLGVGHIFVPLPEKTFMTDCWPLAHRLVDYEADLHEWAVPLVDALPDDVKINFDGIVGDTLLCSNYLTEEYCELAKSNRLNELAEKVVGPEPVMGLFRADLRQRLARDATIAAAKAELNRFAGHPYQVNLFVLSNRTRRAVSLCATKLILQKTESFFPFADNDFFDFAMRIPPRLKMDRRLHRRILDHCYPQLRDVPTTKEVNPKDYYGGKADILAQKRRYLLHFMKTRFMSSRKVLDPWGFSSRLALDFASICLGKDRPYVTCGPAVAVFLEMLARYFPNGVD